MPLTSELLEEGVDFLRLRLNLARLKDITAVVAERDRDLPCVLIDSQVQHGWFSCLRCRANGQLLQLTNPMGEPLHLNQASLS